MPWAAPSAESTRRDKRWIELGEGTHFVMLEKNRIQFIREVELFLEENPQALD